MAKRGRLHLTLKGQKAILDALAALPKEMSHKVFSDAHAMAARPLVQKEKLLAPEGPTGHLVDSIAAQKFPLKRANALGEVQIGARRGRYKGYAAHLVEFGTVERNVKGRGKYRSGYRGRARKKPFAAPAFQATKAEIEISIYKSLSRVINRTMRRYIKAGKIIR